MPVARIQLEDGRIARFEVPDGTSQAEIEEAAASMTESAASINPEVVANSAQQALSRSMLDNIQELGFRQFLNNVLSIPSATGELLALGGAGVQTAAQSFGDNEQGVLERLRQNFEQQRQQLPASALRAIPSPTTGDVIAGVQSSVEGARNVLQGQPAGIGAAFGQAQQAQQARVDQLKQEPGGTIGPIVGDVATLLAGRAPFAQGRAAALAGRRQAATKAFSNAKLPASVRDEFTDVLTGKIIPALKASGADIARGGKRAGEASLEMAALAALNDQDPITSGIMGAGAQSAGSLGLYLSSKPVTRLLPTVATAAVVLQMAKEATPGGSDFILESTEQSIKKVLAAFALGAAGAITGAGRLSGPAAEKFPKLIDSITAVPRGVLQNRLRELAGSDQESASMQALEILSSDPQAFGSNQLKALQRALNSDREGAFTREVNRLQKESARFRGVLDRDSESQ